MDLQSFSHDCFSKISRTLFDFLNNTYWVSLFQRSNSLIFRTGVSCFSVTLFYFTLFCCGGKANLVRFRLFYSTLLTLTDGQTDRQTDRQKNKYTRFAWAGGTFFPVVLLFQFLVLARNRFCFTYYLCTQSTIQLWCCVSFFGSGGKQLLVLRTYLVQDTVVRLCQFFCCGFLVLCTYSVYNTVVRLCQFFLLWQES